ncbi:MAG TPA: TetR/AcrR family transcriptional regulator [Egicoccus sp.]|nr:TetR/AcrR family transcriptional regulator [Egicoccus sp.]HSK22293.1 TetR/AcrR family transcriptional regulator [Egicoccus sp.]
MARYRVGLETRERILSATRRLVSELGVEGVTLKAITDEAGVGAGSFYNLFESKEAAVFEIVREAIEAVDPDPAGEGTDTLEDLVDAFVAFMTDAGPIARIYLQLAVGRGLVDPAIGARTLRSHRRRVERFADAARRQDPSLGRGDAEAMAESLLAGLTGLGITALLDPGFDMGAHARRLLARTAPSAGAPRGPSRGR